MLLDTTEGLKDEKIYVVTEEVANQTQKVTDKEENKETALVSEEKICSNEEVLENKCGNGIVVEEKIIEIFKEFSKAIVEFIVVEGNSKIIKTDNVVYQIIILREQDLNSSTSFVKIG